MDSNQEPGYMKGVLIKNHKNDPKNEFRIQWLRCISDSLNYLFLVQQ